MSAMEIFLLITGGIIFIVSFLLPAGREDTSEENKALVREEIRGFVADEMENIKNQVDDVAEETVGYAMEKTKRSLERISNEKIMAVNEYSDTVLEEIHKNHQEVMFLYDMLNDKHKHLKDAVSEINRTMKEAEETRRRAQAVVDSLQSLAPEETKTGERDTDLENIPEGGQSEERKGTDADISLSKEDERGANSNNRILELYRAGWSKVAIAKELGLGVGEVKLVVDLYKNM